MSTSLNRRRTLLGFLAIFLFVVALAARDVLATTFMSVEPIPSGDVVGQDDLGTILSAGYTDLELWSNRLLADCGIVQDVIDVLTDDGAITSIDSGNTIVGVAAGGFEGVTNPSFVFKIRDSGAGAASPADVDILDNALGFVLNQGGTAHFSPDNPKAYAFALDYAVVTFTGTLDGVDAKAFFDHLGTIDEALWSGQFAGFTQIAFQQSTLNNSMLFLKPAASKHRLITGLSSAVDTTPIPGATYVTLNNNGRPTTAKAGIAFPGNDWILFPGGDQYLANLGNTSRRTVRLLRSLQNQHLAIVDDLVAAIEADDIDGYLASGFTCHAP